MSTSLTLICKASALPLYQNTRVNVCVCLTDEGVLVELLEVRGGRWWPVDELAPVDVGLSEELHRRVRPVPMFDRPWKEGGGLGLALGTTRKVRSGNLADVKSRRLAS